MPPPILRKKLFQYFIAIAAILLAMAFLLLFREKVNVTTVALAFLLVVLFIATFIGRNPALLASVIAVLCFNYYFLHPVGTWTIAEWENLIAWAAFTITAVTAGEISAYARRRADEAERQKDEIKRLYDELQIAFEKASEAEALKRSEKLKSALLDAVTHDLRTPPALLHNLEHNKILHEKVLFVTVKTRPIPFVDWSERTVFQPLNNGFARLKIYYGYMEEPDIPKILSELKERGFKFKADEATYFLGRETIISSKKYSGMARWREKVFSVMSKNARSATSYFKIPPDRVVELGEQIEI